MDPYAAEADVYRLEGLREEFLASGTAVHECRYARIPSAIGSVTSLPGPRTASRRAPGCRRFTSREIQDRHECPPLWSLPRAAIGPWLPRIDSSKHDVYRALPGAPRCRGTTETPTIPGHHPRRRAASLGAPALVACRRFANCEDRSTGWRDV